MPHCHNHILKNNESTALGGEPLLLVGHFIIRPFIYLMYPLTEKQKQKNTHRLAPAWLPTCISYTMLIAYGTLLSSKLFLYVEQAKYFPISEY